MREGDASLLTRGHRATRALRLQSDFYLRTLRRLVLVLGVVIAVAWPTENVALAQPAATATAELPVHVIDQTDPAQYDEVSSWAMEWRALPWYGRALVVLAGVLLLSCGSIVAAGLWGLARAYGRLVRARQRLARAQRLEAALDAAMQRMDEHRRRVQRELRRVP